MIKRTKVKHSDVIDVYTVVASLDTIFSIVNCTELVIFPNIIWLAEAEKRHMDCNVQSRA